MENLYFYLESCDGGYIVDAEYMETKFDSENETLICTGSKEEIDEYIHYLCNGDVSHKREELCQCQALGEYLIETEDGIKYVYIPPTIH